MPIELRDLDDLDPDAVQQNVDEVVARVREDNPTLSLRQGPFFGTLAHYHALMGTRYQAQVRDYLDARSLSVMAANPERASTELVDEAASNFGIERLGGTLARGTVTVVVSDDISVVIGIGSVFEANGKRFVTEQVYTAKLEEAQLISSGDRLLTQQPDGNWAFTIELAAEAEGAEYELKKDTVVVPLVLPNRYVTSYATSDFTGGRSPETNAELTTKLQAGAAAKTVSNRVNDLALLLGDERFSRILQLSIVGLGDPEMTRDQPTIFTISIGGRTDWYVRTQEEYVRLKTTKTATLISKEEDGSGIWQMTFDRDEAAGLLEVAEIKPEGSEDEGGFEVVDDVRGIDVTGDGFKPDLPTAEHGVYSRYQTVTIQFHDDQTLTTDLEVLTTQSYDCERRVMPLIADIQAKLVDWGTRYTGADALVKAPVPCFVTLHLLLVKQAGEADPDLDAMKIALAREINGIGFVGRLYASQLHDVVHGFTDGTTGVRSIDLHGRIRFPDGTIQYVRDAAALVIVPDEERMVSPRTVQFFTSVNDIHIAVETAVPLNL